jgi:glutamate dehydrogenase (NADP+)
VVFNWIEFCSLSSEPIVSTEFIHSELADSRGYLYDEEGFDYGKLALLRDIKLHNKSLR